MAFWRAIVLSLLFSQRKGRAVTEFQFETLRQLAGMKPGSRATAAARAYLLESITQQEAAARARCKQSTVSAAVNRIRAAQRLAKHIWP